MVLPRPTLLLMKIRKGRVGRGTAVHPPSLSHTPLLPHPTPPLAGWGPAIREGSAGRSWTPRPREHTHTHSHRQINTAWTARPSSRSCLAPRGRPASPKHTGATAAPAGGTLHCVASRRCSLVLQSASLGRRPGRSGEKACGPSGPGLSSANSARAGSAGGSACGAAAPGPAPAAHPPPGRWEEAA